MNPPEALSTAAKPYRFVPIIARHRSGTSALREIMSRHKALVTYAEVFHPDFKDNPVFYYHFWPLHFGAHPEHHWPSPENKRAVFDAYVKWIDAHSPPDKTITLNINYNSLHSLDTYWRDVLGAPYLLSMLREKKFPLIHLIRRNCLATHISELRARKTGVWHVKNSETAPLKVTLNGGSLLEELFWRDTEVRRVSEWIKRLHVLELSYEELFEDGKLGSEILSRIAAFLKVRPDPLMVETTFKRTGTPVLEDAVENAGAIRRILAGTKFEWMCDRL